MYLFQGQNCLFGTHSIETRNRSGPEESGSHPEVADPKDGDRCQELPGVHELLQEIHVSICPDS